MKKLLLASTALCFGTVAATAADITAVPVKAPPPVFSSSWAGFYLGVHGGYGWRDSDFSEIISVSPFTTIGGVKSKGGVFGGQAGYNWQYGRVVTGLELDLSDSNINGSVSAPQLIAPGVTETFSTGDKVKFLGTARARLGWLPTDTVLLYGTAGLGWERYERTNAISVVDTTVVPTATALTASTQPFDRFGWVAGAGVEAKLFDPHWIGRLEYLHYDFGRAESLTSLTLSGTGATDGTFTGTGGRQTIDVLRAGLSYRFGDSQAAASPVAYAKAPVAASASWAGFYLGAHAGFGWGQDNFSNQVLVGTVLPTLIDGPQSKGWVGGGQAGFNWQYDRVVAGIEGDFSLSGVKGRSSLTFDDGLGNIETESRSDTAKYLAHFAVASAGYR